jgi:hypothetical protein
MTYNYQLISGPACGTEKEIADGKPEASILYIHQVALANGRYPVHRYDRCYQFQDTIFYHHVGIIGDVGNNEIVYAP